MRYVLSILVQITLESNITSLHFYRLRLTIELVWLVRRSGGLMWGEPLGTSLFYFILLMLLLLFQLECGLSTLSSCNKVAIEFHPTIPFHHWCNHVCFGAEPDCFLWRHSSPCLFIALHYRFSNYWFFMWMIVWFRV